MTEKFIIKKVSNQEIDTEYTNMTIRIATNMRDTFDKLAATSNQSRNTVIINALNYALNQLEIIEENK